MRKEFVSSVSHELKTPLGIIKGFAEGIKDNIVENKKEYYINVILDEIEKMDELVLDLLDLAKLESKAYKLDISEKIWERFYRAEKSRNRKTGGTGLGLSIVKNVLEMHESQFGVENTDAGVSFYFTLRKV